MSSNRPHRTSVLRELSPQQAQAVEALALETARFDGVEALSEQTILHLGSSSGEHRHLLLVGEADGEVLGYAHLDHTGSAPGSEIVVAPGRRRAGVGTAVWASLTQIAPDARVWSHGHLEVARGWAASLGLTVVRELRRMARPLAGLENTEASLPPGYSARTFTPADIDAWVDLNGRAFADHPEQGRVTADDVRARMAEDWFDPLGFFLIEAPAQHDEPDGASDISRLAAFHWTKTADGEGEVYVVGVDPSRQGLGLGKAATSIGLAHLAQQGLPRVTLYVDGDNTAALATYERLGFENIALDVMYGPAATRP